LNAEFAWPTAKKGRFYEKPIAAIIICHKQIGIMRGKNHTRKKGIYTLPVLSKTVKPGNNFYNYVNSHWFRSTRMPLFKHTFDVSEQIEADIEQSLGRILHRAVAIATRGHKPKTPIEDIMDALGRLQMSATRPEKQKFSVDYLKRTVRSLGCIRDNTDISRTLGDMARFQIPTIFSVTDAIIDEKHCIILSPGILGLPNINYYNATAPEKSRNLSAYVTLCKRVSELLDINDISLGIQVEQLLIGKLDAATNPELYKTLDTTTMTIAALKRRFKNIHWEAFFENLGIPPEKQGDICLNIESVSWVEFINQQFEQLLLEQWFSLISLHTVLHALPYLPPPYDDLHFEVFGKLLSGQRHKTPQDVLTMHVLKNQMSKYLSYIYVKTYLSDHFRTEAATFVRSIRDSAVETLKHVQWLSKNTKHRAVKKIKAMTLSVGFPGSNVPPRPPSLQTDNLLANIYLLESSATKDAISKAGQRAQPGADWTEPAYSVNAYYYNERNELIIPAGIFAWPFYSNRSRIGWNYGGLGAVIGHEITHAFDTDGRNFNEQGALEDWWTTEDTRLYLKQTNELVRLYSQTSVGERTKLDGRLTLNENLADLGGVAIALAALLGKVSAVERLEALRDFFISYAVSWRTKEAERKLLQSLFLDKHAPPEFRVNLIVCHFDEWYEVFNVQTGDDLYIPPEERIRIFGGQSKSVS